VKYMDWIDFRRKLKQEWNSMWHELIDDKIRAEGIARRNYPLLFVERGTVVYATRDAKPPDFTEILKAWAPENLKNQVLVNPKVGGWRKFVRVFIQKRVSQNKRKNEASSAKTKNKKQQLKKGGRGWLHLM